jgi:ATP-dependent DNA helicase RecG
VEETKEKILRLINEKPSITTNEIEIATGLSRSGVEYNIWELKKEGIIERYGSDKGGHWIVYIKSN